VRLRLRLPRILCTAVKQRELLCCDISRNEPVSVPAQYRLLYHKADDREKLRSVSMPVVSTTSAAAAAVSAASY
jgi:hypothetical protein